MNIRIPNIKQGSAKHMIIMAILVATAAVLVGFATTVFRERRVLLSSTETFTYDNVERTYRLHTPKNVNNDTKLVIALHGFSGSGRQMAYFSGLHNVDNNTIVVYPDTIKPEPPYKTGWNAEFCCGSGWVSKTNDSDYLAELTKQLIKSNGINPKKVFVTGFSNGGFMAQKLAIDHPGLFSAVAVASSAIGTEKARLNPTEAVPILMLHGSDDSVLPIDGGTKSGDPDFAWLPFSEMVSSWEAVNGEGQTISRVIQGGGHQWFDWRIVNFWHRQPETSKEFLRFFNQQ